MAEQLENPFYNYKPPEFSEIFSLAGRRSFLFFGVVLRVKQTLLADNEDKRTGTQDFLDGDYFVARCDYSEIDPRIGIGRDNASSPQFFRDAVETGIEWAIKEDGSIPVGTKYR